MNIASELKLIPTGKKDLRKFGLVVGGLFALIGLWFLFRGKPIAPIFLYPGLLIFVGGLFLPRSLRILYLIWMSLALVLGFVVSNVLLTLLFVFMVTPMALLARILDKDFLRKRLTPEAPSYWITRDAPQFHPENYLKQY